MVIEQKDINLMDKSYEYIYKTEEEVIVESFKNIVKDYIDNINMLINKDYNELSDEEFYDMLSKAYKIILSDEDYLKIISKRNNKKYNRFMQIDTLMVDSDTVTEGKGKHFDHWEQSYEIKYVIAVSNECEIKYGSVFSKEEIKKMVEDKDIVIIEIKKVPTNRPPLKRESYEEFPILDLGTRYSSCGMFGSIYKDDNFKYIIPMLRKVFTKERVLNDMVDYNHEFNDEIQSILRTNWSNYTQNKLSGSCSKWFSDSEEKLNCDILTKQLNSLRK